MSDHALIVESWWPTVTAHCSCGEWSVDREVARAKGMLARQHEIHVRAAKHRAERLACERACDWYRRTGHCHGCGQPGNWCQCSDAKPCGCRELHPMGSGIGVDAIVAFVDLPINDGQGELWQ